MHEYEIKIISRLGRISLQVAEDHLSDLSAIRAAKQLCGASDSAEVWRGDACIYREQPKPIRLVWPIAGKTSAL